MSRTAPNSSQGLSARACRVVAAAGTAARMADCDHVGTEHLLLGLLQERDGVASAVLDRCGVTFAGVRAQLSRAALPQPRSSGRLALTPAAKRVLRRARNALTLRGDQQIDTEHVLVALVDDPDTLAADVMGALGADATKVRQEAVVALRESGRPRGYRERSSRERSRCTAPAAREIAR